MTADRESSTARRIVLVTHGAPTRDDSASRHLAARGYQLDWVTPAQGQVLPEPDERHAGVIVYGGPQPVTETDRYRFLRDEMDWLGRCIARDMPVLGLCLGGQIVARTLGAAVGPHPDGVHEFGFYRLIPTTAGRSVFGEGITVMQHHYHGFALPRGAQLLARSESYPHQAFRHGANTYAFQFHPEATRRVIARWHAVERPPFDAPGAHSQARQRADIDRYAAPMEAWFTGFLDRLFGNAVV